MGLEETDPWMGDTIGGQRGRRREELISTFLTGSSAPVRHTRGVSVLLQEMVHDKPQSSELK